MSDRKRYIERIRKLFALSSDNPSEEEATAAALQAQRLMVKYSIDPSEIEDGVATRVPACVESEWIGDSRTWRFQLATVVRRAFRCECHEEYGVARGRKVPRIVFYGFEGDAQAAAMTFNYLYKQGSRLARRAEREHREVYGFSHGVYNSFVIGFTGGVESELQAQSQELMVVESEVVRESYEDFKRKQGLVTVKCRRMRLGSAAAEEAGYRAGRDAVSSRRMTSGAPMLC